MAPVISFRKLLQKARDGWCKENVMSYKNIRDISEIAYPDVGFWSGDVADRRSLLSIPTQFFSQKTDVNNDLR